MEVDKNTVKCWSREYIFDAGILPSQIISAGSKLLAAPISFSVACKDKVIMPSLNKYHLDSKSETKVAMSGSLNIANIKLTSKVLTEFDGLSLFEFIRQNGGNAEFDSLSIDIPVKSEHALYYIFFKALQKLEPSGNIPDGKGTVIKTSWRPFAWLGDNDRGLFWFCESDEMWPNRSASNAIEIIRKDKEIVMRLNILAPGQELPGNWKFIFGLQATPVKPMPENRRKWRFSPIDKETIRLYDVLHLTGQGYPEAAVPEKFMKQAEDFNKRNIMWAPYLGVTFISSHSPESIYWRKHWDGGAVDPWVSSCKNKADNHFSYWYQTSPVSKTYSDFLVWKTINFIKKYKLSGMYIDQGHPYPSYRLEAGLGYEKNGIRYSVYPIIAYRNLYRRLYAAIKSLPRDTFIMTHMSAQMTIPFLAYSDAYLNGEHLTPLLKGVNSYVDILPMDMFRASYMGRQWGIAPVLLPEFRFINHGGKEGENPTKELMGMLLVHDVNIWHLWANGKVLNSVYDALDKFGYADSDFIPYFDPVPPATTDMKDIYISAYNKQTDGRALLVVANLSKEKKDREGKVRINAKRLGFPLNKAVSWPDEQMLNVIDDEIHLEVPKMGYRMIMVSK